MEIRAIIPAAGKGTRLHTTGNDAPKVMRICAGRPLLESVLDRISASKTYNGKKYTDSLPYHFFLRSKEYHTMNPKTAAEIAQLLEYLKDNGEKKALQYYRSLYKRYRTDKNFTLKSQD